ncbi:glycosyltransferase family 2 protein [Geminocystis sp. CENA526]|uniref:glycosyltransferase family 2 protein n=1 Tax=Geminocystis sp. CENA526 TaxID=1355871 RepID=UPI003D6E2138
MLLPISALLPTRDRVKPLTRMLESLAQQSVQPLEMIVIDGSTDEVTKKLCEQSIPNLQTKIIYHKAQEIGAATQRNQAMKYATQELIWLIEDDIIFEPDCLMLLWKAIEDNPHLGGVNAMITNQKYQTPGKISRFLFQFLNGKPESSYAGKCLDGALNLLPEDNPSLPDVVSVGWLNTTCTLYRKKVLPDPLFPPIFTGYSLMEDVTLSLTVGKTWQLANVRTAKIFHDSQPGDHKKSVFVLSKMELVNRHYVMTQVLERNTLDDYFKLFVLQLFGILSSLQSFQGWLNLLAMIMGKIFGVMEILFPKKRSMEVKG